MDASQRTETDAAAAAETGATTAPETGSTGHAASGGRIDRLIGKLGSTRSGLAAFFTLGVLENTFLALPMEPVYFPIMAAHPKRAGWIAFSLLAGCVVGAILFYFLAAVAFETLVAPALDAAGLADTLAAKAADMERAAFTTLVVIGVSPVPFQIGTLGAGLVGVGLPVFLAAIVLSRGIRYGSMAVVAAVAGVQAQTFIQRHRTALVIGSLALGVAAVVGLSLFGG